jgi:hypothetical protein
MQKQLTMQLIVQFAEFQPVACIKTYYNPKWRL